MEANNNLAVTLTVSQMSELIRECIKEELKTIEPPKEAESYLTPAQFAEALQISLVTLWSWDKKGITTPLHIGNAKRYRHSDLEKILKSEDNK